MYSVFCKWKSDFLRINQNERIVERVEWNIKGCVYFSKSQTPRGECESIIPATVEDRIQKLRVMFGKFYQQTGVLDLTFGEWTVFLSLSLFRLLTTQSTSCIHTTLCPKVLFGYLQLKCFVSLFKKPSAHCFYTILLILQTKWVTGRKKLTEVIGLMVLWEEHWVIPAGAAVSNFCCGPLENIQNRQQICYTTFFFLFWSDVSCAT